MSFARSIRRNCCGLLAAAALVLAGCADQPATDGDAADAASTPAAAPAVRIEAPADGGVVAAGPVTVTLTVSGVTIAPATDLTAGTGHHHLFLDRDASPAGQPMPAEPGFIVHLGDGSASYTFEAVPAGEHRLIAVVGDRLHIPLQTVAVDTVRFTVR